MRTPDDEFADAVCEFIHDGHLDRNLEQVLSALHDRKRALRGTPGFRREDREVRRG